MNALPDYFPFGLATGHAFLGRETEMHRLRENIAEHRHTLLLAPRRYGKTSLAKHVLNQLNLPWTDIDLFLGIDATAIAKRFMEGINRLLSQISSTPEQWLNSLKHFFAQSDQKWSFSFSGVRLELRPEKYTDVAKIILEGLEALEVLLTKKKQYVVFFADELQEITKLKEGQEIEGALRHYAQKKGHIIFIFSGSSRRLLQSMFGDQNRPLYELCDWIRVPKLSALLYEKYLNGVTQKTFKKKLPEEVFNEIIHLSECHAKYVYTLCATLWSHCKRQQIFPDVKSVQEAWHVYVSDRIKPTRDKLSHLSGSQLKLLVLVALGHTQMTAKEVQQKTGITGPTILHALNILEDEDFLEKSEANVYQLIDPLIKTILIRYYKDAF